DGGELRSETAGERTFIPSAKEGGLMTIATFKRNPVSQTRATSMVTGVKYVIIIYNETAGKVEQVVQAEAGTIPVDIYPTYGATHSIIAYSVNTTNAGDLPTPPSVGATNPTLSGIRGDVDLLYYHSGSLLMTGTGLVNVAITFSHKYSFITATLDVSELILNKSQDATGSSVAAVNESIGSEITSLSSGTAGNLYNADLDLQTGTLSPSGTAQTCTLAFPTNTNMSSVSFYAYTNNAPLSVTFPNYMELAYTANNNYQHNLSLSFTTGAAPLPGYKYTLKAKQISYCAAKVDASATPWRVFSCYNLGADTSLDPFIPAAGLHGAKYRWGAKNASYTMAQDQSNSDIIPGWTLSSTTTYPFQTTSGDWDMTNNNPCSPGWRVPTNAEWLGVINKSQNKQTNVGTNWSSEATNYTSGRKFGNILYLPTTGYRFDINGALYYRGSYGYYWSSTRYSNSYANLMSLYDKQTTTYNTYRSHGFSVRCIAE
ncbi:MAG: FISUMP domain-containing protein, partial [Dysgonamonadaceae bacterium]